MNSETRRRVHTLNHLLPLFTYCFLLLFSNRSLSIYLYALFVEPRPEPAACERVGVLHVLRVLLHGAGGDAAGAAGLPPRPRRTLRLRGPHGPSSILRIRQVN